MQRRLVPQPLWNLRIPNGCLKPCRRNEKWHENSHSTSSVDNHVNKSLNSEKDGANGVHIHRIAYFLGIRRTSTAPQLIDIHA
jgi:hypothetical protein